MNHDYSPEAVSGFNGGGNRKRGVRDEPPSPQGGPGASPEKVLDFKA